MRLSNQEIYILTNIIIDNIMVTLFSHTLWYFYLRHCLNWAKVQINSNFQYIHIVHTQAEDSVFYGDSNKHRVITWSGQRTRDWHTVWSTDPLWLEF